MTHQALALQRQPAKAVPANLSLQRSCTCEQSGEQCARCADKHHPLQRLATSGKLPLGMPASVSSVLGSGGRPLPPATRMEMENAFGHDFSSVRIHADTDAQRSAVEVSARAYTVGQHIVLGEAAPDLNGTAGKRLIGHELTHVVQQSRGSGVAPGIDPDPALETEAQRVGDDVSAGRQALVGGLSPIALSRDALPGTPAAAPAPAEEMYEYPFKGEMKRVTKKELQRILRNELRNIKDLAESGRAMQHQLLDEYQGGVESFSDIYHKPKALIGIFSDMWGDTTPPWVGMWGHPSHSADLGLADVEKGDFKNAGRHLTMALSDYQDCEKEWREYIEKTTAGAEKLVGHLETVRDVSFTIALASGAALAAPLVATGVSALGVTGVGATALTAGGTAVIVGGEGVLLGGGSTAIASKVNTGKIDWDAVEHDAAKWGKQGAITGLTAGASQALFGAGAVAKGLPFINQAIRKCAVGAGISVGGEVSTMLLDALYPTEKPADVAAAKARALIPAPVRSAITGCISSALGIPPGKVPAPVAAVGNKVIEGGVGFLDAKLQGQTNEEAAKSAVTGVVVSSAVGHGQAGTDKAKAKRAAAKAQAKAKEAPAPKSQSPEKAPVAEPAPHAEPPAKKAAAKHEKDPAKAKKGEGHDGPEPTGKSQPAPEPEPTVNPKEATAAEDLHNGHEAVVTPKGVAICSPAPCPVIHLEYKAELDANPKLAARNKRIQAKRKTNPKQASKEAAALIKELDKIRAKAKAKEPEPVLGSSNPKPGEALVGRSKPQMRARALKIIAADPNHPLRFLLTKGGSFKSQRGMSHATLINRPDLVQMGHVRSDKLGGPEHVMLQGAWENQLNNISIEHRRVKGAVLNQPAVAIGGIAVDVRTAQSWENLGFLKAGTVASSPKVLIPALDD